MNEVSQVFFCSFLLYSAAIVSNPLTAIACPHSQLILARYVDVPMGCLSAPGKHYAGWWTQRTFNNEGMTLNIRPLDYQSKSTYQGKTLIGSVTAVAKDVLLFNRIGPTRSELYVANADGSGEHKLIASTGFDYNARYSDDGNWIVFTSEREGRGQSDIRGALSGLDSCLT